MTPVRLLILPATVEQPCRQILFGPEDHVMEDSRLDYGGPWLGDVPTVLAVPGADVLARRLVLPNGPRAQVEAAAALILEEELASTREPLRVAMGPQEADGARLVAAASANRVNAWIEMARALGADPVAEIKGQGGVVFGRRGVTISPCPLSLTSCRCCCRTGASHRSSPGRASWPPSPPQRARRS